MARLTRMLASTLLGAVLGGVLTAAVFIAGALIDGTRAGEAFGFGLAVGFAGAGVGLLIGLIIGLLRLRAGGGALVGVLVTVAAVAFYVFSIGRPGQAAFFLRESVVIVLVVGLPAVLTGFLTGWLTNRTSATSGRAAEVGTTTESDREAMGGSS